MVMYTLCDDGVLLEINLITRYGSTLVSLGTVVPWDCIGCFPTPIHKEILVFTFNICILTSR